MCPLLQAGELAASSGEGGEVQAPLGNLSGLLPFLAHQPRGPSLPAFLADQLKQGKGSSLQV